MVDSVKDLYMRCINTETDNTIYKYGVRVNEDHKPKISYCIGIIHYNSRYYSKIYFSCNGLYDYFYGVTLYITFTAYDYL